MEWARPLLDILQSREVKKSVFLLYFQLYKVYFKGLEYTEKSASEVAALKN